MLAAIIRRCSHSDWVPGRLIALVYSIQAGSARAARYKNHAVSKQRQTGSGYSGVRMMHAASHLNIQKIDLHKTKHFFMIAKDDF
jgi:hypothetical protein